MPIRVLLAEDNALLREGLCQLIRLQDDLDLVSVAVDFDSLLSMAEDASPDVVITDIRMPPTGTDEGIRAAAELRDRHPEMGVVVLSQYASPEYALALFDKGSERRAYLLKERVADVGQLVSAITTVHEGGSVIDPKVVEALVESRSQRNRTGLDRLTPRESEVLAEMAQGKSNGAIASSLFLSERAVEKHINAIFSKLGLSEERELNRRVKAVLLYLDPRRA